MKILLAGYRSYLACVAGGIFGTQEVKFLGGGAAKSERRSREKYFPILLTASSFVAGPTPKLYFACAYTMPPATQARSYRILLFHLHK